MECRPLASPVRESLPVVALLTLTVRACETLILGLTDADGNPLAELRSGSSCRIAIGFSSRAAYLRC